MSLAISASWYLQPSGNIKKNHTIVIDDKKITEILPTDKFVKPQGTEHYKLDQHLVTPPFVNAHTHLPETLIRGLSDDTDLETWLYDNVWRVEPYMTAEDARAGTLLGIAELLSTGSGFFIDQFYYSEVIAEAVLESGIKAFLAPSIFDNNPETTTISAAYTKNVSILKKYHLKDERLMIGFGPHAPYSIDDELYQKLYDLSIKHDTYIHTHLSETRKEVQESINRLGMTPIQHMSSIGVLDRVLAAHCVHLQPVDFDLLKQNDTTVLHNPQSNLKLGSGIADISKMIAEGIRVLIGTDGSASNNNLDMLEEIRTAMLLQKGVTMDPRVFSIQDAMRLVTRNANEVVGQLYSGKIEVDQPADMVVWDLKQICTTPVIYPLSNLLFSANSNSVKMNVINGKILYFDKNFRTIDIHKVKDDVQKSSDRMRQQSEHSQETS